MLGSGIGRWAIAALLAAFAFADGAAQYAMAATPLPRLLHLSPRVLGFLKVNFAPTEQRLCFINVWMHITHHVDCLLHGELHEWMAYSIWSLDSIQDVVGVSIDHRQPPLQLQLARAVLLLGALQLYRFLFAVGSLAVRIP